MSHKNCRWHETIERTVHYYQSDFSASQILGQLSNYDDILNRQIQTTRIASNDVLASSEKMRATAQVCQPENSRAKTNAPENANEDNIQDALENNKRDEKEKVTKANED